MGEPTEAALKVLVEKLGCADEKLTESLLTLPPRERATAINDYYEKSISRLLTFEFSRDRKMMSVLVRRRLGHGALFVKGAPESVLEACTSFQAQDRTGRLTSGLRKSLLKQTVAYGKAGLRTLALAYVMVDDTDVAHYQSQSTADYSRFEKNLTFVGLVGMLDPPRPEVKVAVANCRAAGIRVVCITGDNKGTAETICRQIGIFGEREDLTGKSYTGRELDELSKEEKVIAVQRASLFSRTEPGHKSQLVDLLQGLGLVVAMVRNLIEYVSCLIFHYCCRLEVLIYFLNMYWHIDIASDGVNDAPALKKADIGVAMGSGTDVAKLAADMVLADSNFATIELAVEEGRLIYNNTKQFIRYLSASALVLFAITLPYRPVVSSNIGEVVRYVLNYSFVV